jgi:hypothetical protein
MYCQIPGIITENNTTPGSVSQFLIIPFQPIASKNAFTGPKAGLKNSENIRPITVAEITTGTKYTDWKKWKPRTVRYTRYARIRARGS